MTWYDGGLLPPTPVQAPDGFTLDPNGGVIFVGERGLLIHETYGENPRFLSNDPAVDLEAEAADVPVSLPRIEGGRGAHEMNWVRAIQGTGAGLEPVRVRRPTSTRSCSWASPRCGPGSPLEVARDGDDH